MKHPALDVDGVVDGDFLLAVVDDFNPSAVDTNNSTTTFYFADARHRDLASDAIVRAYPDAVVGVRDVDDENWAQRSQENVTPVTVGRITIAPPWAVDTSPSPKPLDSGPFQIVIVPSMGFGTGHHATTRLCLRGLQELDLDGASVLDVGTGSGVLAIAARSLGAANVAGIDDDPDAIQSATDNLAANPGVDHVHFETIDLRAAPLPRVDVVTANLTGVLLERSADLLMQAIKPGGGALVLSGLQRHERDQVVRAFARAHLVWEATEDEWVGIIVRL